MSEAVLGAVPVRTGPVRRDIISLTGLIGCPVMTGAGTRVGRVADVAVGTPGGAVYPPVTGIVARAGERRVFAAAAAIAWDGSGCVRLRAGDAGLAEFSAEAGSVLLGRDILDQQLVHTGEARVLRAADLYLAPAGDGVRLAGVACDRETLLRRLGPRWVRRRPVPGAIIDWAVIGSFSAGGGPVPGSDRQRVSPAVALREAGPGQGAELAGRAGAIMTAALVCAQAGETAGEVRHRLGRQAGDWTRAGSVAVLDDCGRAAGDVGVFDLLVSDSGRRLAELAAEFPPVTVRLDAGPPAVMAALAQSRRSSVLVTDGGGRPLGRVGWAPLTCGAPGHAGRAGCPP
jgi:hypothetical protein